MRTLYLVRHAKSSWEDPDLDDFDRPLSERGEKDAPRMGNRLKERNVLPDAIYSSLALRAITTAKIIAGILGFTENAIHSERKLYHAGGEGLLQILTRTPDEYNDIMIVGHNPSLTEFANDLLDENIENIPTCGVVTAKLKIVSWKDVKWKCGKLVSFDYPKDKG